MRVYSDRVLLPSEDGGLQVKPALVGIQGGVIDSVRVEDEPFGQTLEPDVDHLGDKLLTPAFINAHTHVAMSVYRGLLSGDHMRGNVVESFYFQVEAALDGADIRAFARMGAYESLLAGVGTIWDHYYGGLELVKGIDDVGLTATVALTLQDLNGPGVAYLEDQLAATEHLAGSAKWRKKGIVAALGPHATDTVSDGLWRVVADLRERLQLPVHAHVAQSIEEVERSFEAHGCSPVERLYRLGLLGGSQDFLMVHSLFVSESDLLRIDPATDCLGFCPFSQAQFCFPAHIPSWQRRGARVLVGTDCGASNDTMNVQQELRLIAGAPGLSGTWSQAREAFESKGTLAAAQALQSHRVGAFDRSIARLGDVDLLGMVWGDAGDYHPDLPVGSIEEGRFANFVIWNLDDPGLWPAPDPLRALVMGDATQAIEQVMIAGQWRGQRGHFRQSIVASDDYREARLEAEQRLAALLARID